MILETHRYRKYSNFGLFSTFDEKSLRDGTVHRVLKMHQNGKNHAKKLGSFQYSPQPQICCTSHSQLHNGKNLTGFQKTEIKTDEYERRLQGWELSD